MRSPDLLDGFSRALLQTRLPILCSPEIAFGSDGSYSVLTAADALLELLKNSDSRPSSIPRLTARIVRNATDACATLERIPQRLSSEVTRDMRRLESQRQQTSDGLNVRYFASPLWGQRVPSSWDAALRLWRQHLVGFGLSRLWQFYYNRLAGRGIALRTVKSHLQVWARTYELSTKPTCFISYATRDQAFAQRLYDDLQNHGVKCWFAPHHLKAGDVFREKIDEAIYSYDRLLLILSEDSIKSAWVQDEVEACLERERHDQSRVLFPIRLDGSVFKAEEAWVASIRRRRHIGDFHQWRNLQAYEKAFDRLLNDLDPDDEHEKL
jgi:hypothetical protein